MYEKSVKIPDAWKKDEEVFEQLRKLSDYNEPAYQLKEAEYYGLESIKLCAVQPESAGGSAVSYFCLKFNDTKIFMNNRKDFKAEGKMQPLVQLILTLYKSIKNQIVPPSANIENLADECAGMNIVQEAKQQEINTTLSNSFGFGGTNGCLVLKKYVD